jgi:hypothetical protein
MTYDELYPDAVELSFAEGDLLRVEKLQECSICQTSTPWMDMDFHAHVCSLNCLSKMNDDYRDA